MGESGVLSVNRHVVFVPSKFVNI